MGLSPQDMDVARTVLRNLKGDRYKNWNYLFITPFDLKQVPGYLDVVSKPLDLQTVTQNLEAGQYDSLAAVWTEIKCTFENAIKYHGSRETKWIAKMAKDMIKYFNKERTKAEKARASGASSSGSVTQSKPTIKLKLGKQLPTAASKAAKAVPSQGKVPPVKVDAAPSSADAPARPKKAPKLKVKLPTKKSAPETAPAAPPAEPKSKPKPPKPVIRLKLKASSAVASTAAPSSSTPSSTKSSVAAAPSAAAASATPPSAPTSAASSKSTKSSKSSSSSSGPKISVKLGSNSRGKELPKGVVQPPVPKSAKTSASTKSASSSKATSSKAATSKASSKASAASQSSSPPNNAPTPAPPSTASNAASAPKAGQKRKRNKKATGSSAKDNVPATAGGALPPAQIQACSKVLLALKRRQQKNISWFLAPVSDKAIIQDYRAKIKYPVDVGKIQAKVDGKSYKSLADFCLDLRRIYSNCLCFNTSMKDSIRAVAVELVETSEDLMTFFFSQAGNAAYPKLLYCWKKCMEVLGTLYSLTNSMDGEPTVLYFLHPVKVYCGGQFPPDYLEKVKKPMDFQTVTSNLLEGRYQSVSEFAADCKLIVQNCNTYYTGREDGKLYVDQANRLGTVMTQELDQLTQYDKSPKAAADRLKANTASMLILRPPIPTLVSVVDDLRSLKYSDKATKITEPAMGPFEKPVSPTVFPDYAQKISEQMDLQAVEKKAKSGAYASPEDFEYDMILIFRNCEKYHSQRNGEHLVSMAKFAAKNFRRIFTAKMKAIEDPSSAPAPRSRPETPSSQQAETGSSAGPPSKKQKVEGNGAPKGKATPRISITLSSSAAASAAAAASSRSKSPKPPSQTLKKNTVSPNKAANQPLPLHIAITRVKEAFPSRRAVKGLTSWEGDCARYFRELLRHPWLSAARPKFIFHVPVTMLFPEIREAYAAKIRKPMDLTTVECTLLAGGRYTSCEDLIEDVALTFSNAIRFNKDGRDIGDPLSCAYYDASVHLLRYARWLSLELLSQYIEDTDHVDEGGADGLPPLSWKLTRKNKEIAQKEQMEIVTKEPIDKSLEGDRYTWHEAECEKLLKALRHQSDVKLMTYFIRADYPPDYTVFISKPMDWEKVQKNLKKRQYDNFGQIVEDLRLIFKNALKYNARLKDRADTVSGRAYSAAEQMSAKLELAIRKLMLAVSDRVERDRIENDNAEREMDAEEKAEEARIRAAWKKDDKEGSSPPASAGGGGLDAARGGGNSLGQKIRLTRRPLARREATDFEIPFFEDEDDAQHERSFLELIKMQKSMFEKQRQDQVRMRQTANTVAYAVHSRLLQKTLAQKWANDELQKRSQPPMEVEPATATGDGTTNEESGNTEDTKALASSVLQELEREDRSQIKISFGKLGAKKKRGKKRPNPFDV